ncbi:hypothetical protein TEA_019167 [Camellia sinensis var. sinensis]|uniref:Mur ligase C-terminal domain-containing protein n=1 Tax=Camellia sinensis var. sinensis TaxID=542762 RepID=A0A4S4EJM5_CAMSN|nr:hypothetical protein TEA_019167 [Camellia sinensis var. sinensis]
MCSYIPSLNWLEIDERFSIPFLSSFEIADLFLSSTILPKWTGDSKGHIARDYIQEMASDSLFCTHIAIFRGCPVADISLQIPGVHNVLNSLAVITTVTAIFRNQMHIYESVDLMRLHLNNFKGVSRRFEMIGRVRGCHICDDYAHHPTEVRAVLQAARQRFQYEDLLVVFQPHTYSRLAALKNEFANAFSDADIVVVTEIYGARETNLWKISGRDLATSIIGPSSEYIPSLGDVVDKLARYISKDPDRATAILTLGAGLNSFMPTSTTFMQGFLSHLPDGTFPSVKSESEDQG